jgi:hypothetical protein
LAFSFLRAAITFSESALLLAVAGNGAVVAVTEAYDDFDFLLSVEAASSLPLSIPSVADAGDAGELNSAGGGAEGAEGGVGVGFVFRVGRGFRFLGDCAVAVGTGLVPLGKEPETDAAFSSYTKPE